MCVVLGVKGFLRGLVSEVVGLIALVVGVVVASRNAAEFGGFLSGLIPSLKLSDATSYFIGLFLLFLGIFLLIVICGKLLTKVVKVSGLGAFDRAGGAAFSIAKVVCVVAILLSLVSRFDVMQSFMRQYLAGSVGYEFLVGLGETLMKIDYNEILDTKMLQNATR